MQQYLDYMRNIQQNGIVKTDRTGTGTTSIFGAQMRFNLLDGFPLVTTKKTHMKSIIHELIWFLAGDTNTKYLNNNGVTIWDEWADENGELGPIYGYQWRSWPGKAYTESTFVRGEPDLDTGAETIYEHQEIKYETIDQIAQVIDQIKNNPDSRRMIVSAWNVADIPNMKLPPCHALFQFYTRELTEEQRRNYAATEMGLLGPTLDDWGHASMDVVKIPRRYLDCQLYQRSIH